jgi:hypothetical protein
MLRVLALVLGGSALGVVQKLRDSGDQALFELDFKDIISRNMDQVSRERGQEVPGLRSISSLFTLESLAEGQESDLPTLFATLFEDSDPRLTGLLPSNDTVLNPVVLTLHWHYTDTILTLSCQHTDTIRTPYGHYTDIILIPHYHYITLH